MTKEELIKHIEKEKVICCTMKNALKKALEREEETVKIYYKCDDFYWESNVDFISTYEIYEQRKAKLVELEVALSNKGKVE